jgi:hypothetical protein
MTYVHPKPVRAEPVEALPFLLQLSERKGQHFDKLSANGEKGMAQ